MPVHNTLDIACRKKLMQATETSHSDSEPAHCSLLPCDAHEEGDEGSPGLLFFPSH